MLDILVSRADVGFLPLTVPHLVRSCRFPFRRRRLLVDTRPLAGDYATRAGAGSMAELCRLCDGFQREGLVDSVEAIDYTESVRLEVMVRHFGEDPDSTHSAKGYPLYGMAYGIATAGTAYYVHFDSDMLLYQSPDASWIAAGIDLLESDPDVLCVLPLPGPPTVDGTLNQPYTGYRVDPRGHYVFKAFTSRKFLIDVARFESVLPLQLLYRPGKHGGPPRLEPWEVLVSGLLRDTRYVRADLAAPTAWTLHPLDHGPQFLRCLPEIISRVERGWFPPGQAGKYDLVPELWSL